ncbi:MAG: PaaI family thioesterase [Acidimicrobiales bacterium]
MTPFDELLGARADGDATIFSFGRGLHGAFGGVFGGLLAAATVRTARRLAAGRTPAGLDCRFVRSLPAGDARATTTLVHRGRRLTCVRVDVVDDGGRLATTATVSFVDGDRLHPLDVDGPPAPAPGRLRRWGLPAGVDAPIMDLLDPRLGAIGPGVIAAEVRRPWDDPEGGRDAEAACVAGDLCVGPPVAAACEGAWLPHPNPDLSLRFAPMAAVGPRLTGIGRVVRIAGGQAVVGVDVHAAGQRFAVGAATSMLLRGEDR